MAQKFEMDYILERFNTEFAYYLNVATIIKESGRGAAYYKKSDVASICKGINRILNDKFFTANLYWRKSSNHRREVLATLSTVATLYPSEDDDNLPSWAEIGLQKYDADGEYIYC